MRSALNSVFSVLRVLALLSFATRPTTGFFWPFAFPFFNRGTATTTATGTINYGFLRPAIIVPVTTTTEATTTTTTTPTPQIFISNGAGGFIQVPVNSSNIFLNLANRPFPGGIAQPIFGGAVVPGNGTVVVAGGGFGGFPGSFGGVAAPTGGIAAPIGGGGFVLPAGFPATGGVAASGIIPGIFPPGILGRSAGSSKGPSKTGTGRVIFASKKKK